MSEESFEAQLIVSPVWRFQSSMVGASLTGTTLMVMTSSTAFWFSAPSSDRLSVMSHEPPASKSMPDLPVTVSTVSSTMPTLNSGQVSSTVTPQVYTWRDGRSRSAGP